MQIAILEKTFIANINSEIKRILIEFRVVILIKKLQKSPIVSGPLILDVYWLFFHKNLSCK